MGQTVQLGQVLAGKYRVERILGEGGMGVVLAARHVHLGQKVAIKIMLPKATELFPDASERFLREAQALVRLTGENVARVIDVGTLDRHTPYLVMEYLDGADLRELLARTGPFAIEDAVDYVIQACVAMAEAHAQGIIHRDLKPGNLFLTKRNGRALIKVLDFGISKVAELSENQPTMTQTWGSMGSPPYMSPEQSKSAKYVDARSDVWSLGAILYQLLSGRLPFSGEAAPEIFAKIMYKPPAPIRDEAPWVPEQLEAVLLRCLDKDPDRRIQSMPELAEALAPFASAAGQTIAETMLGVEDITDFSPVMFDSNDERGLPSVIINGPPSSHDLSVPPELSRTLQERSQGQIVFVGRQARSHAGGHRRWLVAVVGLLFVAGVVGGAALFDWRGRHNAPADGVDPLRPGALGTAPGPIGEADGHGPVGSPAQPGDVAEDPGRGPAGDGDDPTATGAATAGAADGDGDADGDATDGDAGGDADSDATDGDAALSKDDGERREVKRGGKTTRPKPRRKRRRKRARKAEDPFGSVGEPIR